MPCKSSSGINIGTSKEFTVIKTVKNTVIKTVPVTSAQQSVTLQLWLKHPALRYTDTHSCLFMQTHSHRHGVRDSLFLMLWEMKTWVQVARITPGTVRGRRVRGGIALTRYRTTQSPDITESETHARDSLFSSLVLNPAEARKTLVKLYSINFTRNWCVYWLVQIYIIMHKKWFKYLLCIWI